MNFFRYTADYREMLLLEFIDENRNISQPDIARYIGSSASMVNTYIDKYEAKGLLKRNYKSLKIVEYNITPKGRKRKNFLQITYMKELMKLYVQGRKTVGYFLDSIVDKGLKDVVFYGAGEVAEIMLDIININNFDISVKCIIDDDVEKQNTKLKGINVCALSELDNYIHDGIIITSYAYEEEIIKKLKQVNYPMDKIVRYFEV